MAVRSWYRLNWGTFEFYPKVFQYLSKIAEELNFEIVMITNQDGLGTEVYPEDTFWPVHNFVIKTFEQEGVVFKEQFIDRTFAKDNAPTRKPNTGLLTKYFSEDYDLTNSYIIGDRLTDIELAKNLGARGIFINDNTNLGTDEVTVSNNELQQYIALETNDWEAIYEFLKTTERVGSIERNTNETKIKINLNLDGTGKSSVDTGIAFFDHMLDQIARHGQFDLNINIVTISIVPFSSVYKHTLSAIFMLDVLHHSLLYISQRRSHPAIQPWEMHACLQPRRSPATALC